MVGEGEMVQIFTPSGPLWGRKRRRRRRHNFDLQQIPSFEAFQQQQSIRAMYRQFMRLAYGSSSAKDELIAQVRRELGRVIG